MATNTKTLSLLRPAKEAENVFFPLNETADKVLELLDLHEETATFIRAPVASGKTTLAVFLVTNPNYLDKFTLVQGTPNDESDFRVGIIKACGLDAARTTLQGALRQLSRSGKTLIIDEAHKLFKHPALKDELLKSPDSWSDCKPPKFLFFSATTESGTEEIFGAPPEIEKKYMWYPPLPSAATMVDELAQAGVWLDVGSVNFLFRLCSGHRGVFMKTMGWIQEVQRQQEGASSSPWTTEDAVSMVRSSISDSASNGGCGWSTGIRKAWAESRAVKVNGPYSNPLKIPKTFLEVLFGGPKTKGEIGPDVRDLTIAGLLTPEQTDVKEEFVLCDWDDTDKRYAIANSLMAEYYGKLFQDNTLYTRDYIEHDPQSVSDLVARALPLMNFASVVQPPIPKVQGEVPVSQSGIMPQTPLSRDKLPFEDDYNDALVAALKMQQYAVTTPNNPTTGKPDVVVTYGGSKTAVVESIVATQRDVAHREHAQRFADASKPSYSKATLKGLLTIGKDANVVKKRLMNLTNTATFVEDLEAVGIVVSLSYDVYEMWVRPSLKTGVALKGPYLFNCDGTPRKLEYMRTGKNRMVPASRCHKRQRTS